MALTLATQMACGNEYVFRTGNVDITRKKINFKSDRCPSKPFLWLYRIIYTANFFAGNSMMIRKSFLENGSVLPFPNEVYHDYWLVACSCLSGGFAYIDNPITKRRSHEGNVTGIQFEEGSFVQKVVRRLFVSKNKKKLQENTLQSLACVDHLLKRFSMGSEERKVLLNLKSILEGRLSSPFSIRHLKGFFLLVTCYSLIFFDEKRIKPIRLLSYLL